MTRYPHVIELRGPWEYAVVPTPSPASREATQCATGAEAHLVAASRYAPPERRAKLPASWDALLGPDFRGQVRLLRRFGRPGRLDPHERLWLVIAADGVGHAYLDGSSLGVIESDNAAGGSHAFDITAAAHAAHQAGRKLELKIELTRPPEESSGPRAASSGGAAGACSIVDVRLEVRLAVSGGAGA